MLDQISRYERQVFIHSCWYWCENKKCFTRLQNHFFYSPKITYGIDFNISNAQNVFIYVKGRTLTPYGTFQQCTRTRNIENVYFYCECYDKEEQYHNIDTLQDNSKESLNHNILKNVCLTLDEEDEFTFLETHFWSFTHITNILMILLIPVNISIVKIWLKAKAFN